MELIRKNMLILLAVIAAIWFANLEYRTLVKPDEGRYAEIPREMVASGDWVTPRLNELKYFEKPPLQYWATATAYEVFGEHQWTSRLWTGLTGFAGILLVWLVGLHLFGREAAGYAALILTSSMLYVMMGHINTLDMGVTFFISLGIFGFLLAQAQANERKRRNWMLLAWAGMALAVLSKGLMGIVLPGTAVFLYCMVQRDFTVLKRMHWLPGLALFFAIVTPWFYFVMKANPEFFERFFIYEHYTRFTTKDLGRYQPWYYFIPILLLGALPWTVTMFDSMWRTARNSSLPAGMFNTRHFLLVWAVFIYVFFSISGSKLPSYLLPMFPPLALLMGNRLVEMRERTLFWQVIPAVPFAFVVIALAFYVGKMADTPNQAELYPHYTPWLIASALILLAGVAAGMFLLWRTKKRPAIVVLALTALLSTQVAISGYESVARERSAKHIAEAIRDRIKPGVPFYSVLTYEQTLPFYLKRTFTLVEFEDEMAYGIKQEPQKWIPSVAAFPAIWQAQPEAYAIVPTGFFPLLKSYNLPMQVIFEDTQHVVVKKP